MSSAQPRRDATSAPAAFANRSVRSSGQPASSPWQSAPPKASPAPRPLTTSTSTGSTSTSSSPDAATTPSLPRLTTARSGPSSSTARALSSGKSSSPSVTVTSSSFPTTAGRVRERFAVPAASLAGGGPEHGPIVEIVDDERPATPPPQRRQRRRSARLLREAGPGCPEQCRLRRHVPQLVQLQVRGLRLPIEEQRKPIGRKDLAEGERRA